MNAQIKKIVIGIAGIGIIGVAGVLFLMDDPQKPTLKQPPEVKGSPYQSKIVPVEEVEQIATKTAPAIAVTPAPLVLAPKENAKKEKQAAEIKASPQESPLVEQQPKADPITNNIRIKKQTNDKPVARKVTALKLEEATSIVPRKKLQHIGFTKHAASKAKTAAPKITTLKLKKSTSVAPVESLHKAWVIQLGSFSNNKNAINLRDKLKDAGFTSFVETKQINNKKTARVYVGPEKALRNAKKVLAQLKKEQNIKGIIVGYDN